MESFNTLVLSLPTRNSTLRMRLWRALKDSGCGVLRDGVYVLPAAADPAGLARLESDIRAHGGFVRCHALALDLVAFAVGSFPNERCAARYCCISHRCLFRQAP